MNSALQRMLAPAAVAVVGASDRDGNLGVRTIGYLQAAGFAGAIFPVNERYPEVAGLKCFPSIQACPQAVDLVLVFVPAAAVEAVIEDCGRAGVPAAVLFSSGFAETGAAGQVAQERLRLLASRHGVRILGPNCQGFVHTSSRTVASFSQALQGGLAPPTGVAYVGQSGAIGGSILDLSRELGLGLTAWVSTGNQLDLTVVEMAVELIEDRQIRLLLLYLEQQPSASSWQTLIRRADQLGKPLVVLTAGQSESGRRAAASHTGAMVAPHAAFELMSRAHGVTQVGDVDQLLLAGQMLLPGRRAGGRNVAVVTTSGGAGILAADQLEAGHYAVPQLSADTQSELSLTVPDFGAVANPVDVTAQLFRDGNEAFGQVCRTVAADPSIDSMIVVLTLIAGAPAADLAEVVSDAIAAISVPVVVVWLAGRENTTQARAVYRDHGVVVVDSVTRAVQALEMVTPVVPRMTRPGSSVVPGRRPALDLSELVQNKVLTESAAATLLDALGISRPRGDMATSPEEALALAARLATPHSDSVVLKVQSPALLHKSEAGGVRIGVPPELAARAFEELKSAVLAFHPGISVDGVLVQELAPPGVELLIGAVGSSDGYPPVLTVGMGGVEAELRPDIAMAAVPVDAGQAEAMLQQLAGWPLLNGFRGRPPADVDAVVAVIVAISVLAEQLSDRLAEIEINPLLVHPAGQGATAADFLLRCNY